ncbi:hypothetical protein [Saccharothrix sp. HUAS TT10]|uniref:hypothetical protein n=1 Tax=Saccharothrix sp. HUAS TT10 TaxID=3447450 RepID=UPI003F72DDF2
MLLRQNLAQTVAADWFGGSQPTVSRVFRRIAPLIGQVTCPPHPTAARRVARTGGAGRRRPDPHQRPRGPPQGQLQQRTPPGRRDGAGSWPRWTAPCSRSPSRSRAAPTTRPPTPAPAWPTCSPTPP